MGSRIGWRRDHRGLSAARQEPLVGDGAGYGYRFVVNAVSTPRKEHRNVEGCRNHVHVARRLRRRPQRRRGRGIRLVPQLGERRVPHRRFGPHDVQGVRAECRAPSRSVVRTWCRAHRSTHFRRRPRLGRKPRLGTSIRPYPPHPRRMAATQLDSPLRHRRHRKRREPGQSRRPREVRWGPRRRHHPAVTECWSPRRNPRRHRGASSRFGGSTVRPPRPHASRPWQPDGDRGRRRYPPALSGTQEHVMRPLRYSVNVTLDGCYDHRTGFPDEDLHRHAAENIAQADALLFGRVTYEMMEAAWRRPAPAGTRPDWMEPFGRTIDAAKKYVVSSTLTQVDWNAELVRGDLAKAVQQLKQEPGKGLFTGGVTLPLALAELGLINEYEFVVHPRLAGHGPTLFAGLSKLVDLKLVDRREFGSGAVALRYETRR